MIHNRKVYVAPFLALLSLLSLAVVPRAQESAPVRKMKMTDVALYGGPRRSSEGVPLTAGPVRMTFQDGELRYLYVGDTEVVRRVYFAVRDPAWDTAMPEFRKSTVRIKDGGFEVDLEATCKTATADYAWTGKITGTAEGVITFRAAGAAGRDFASPRIGLCVLYGSPSVAGRRFDSVKPDGTVVPGTFPALVSPRLVASKCETLRYTAANGAGVRTTAFGSIFDMEDQRTYSDSSFKAYAPLAYPYPNVKKAVRGEQSVTIQVADDAPVSARASIPIVVHVGPLLAGIKVPKVGAADPKSGGVFGDVNGRAERYKGATALTWGFNPAVHLPDDDTYFENISTIVEQVKTARSYAPAAVITIDPVSIDSTHPRPVHEPRNKGLFAAAWSAAFLSHAALAGVEEVKFQVGEPGNAGYARMVQKDIGQYAGRGIFDATVEGPLPPRVDVLAIDAGDGTTVLYLVNRTGAPQTVMLEGLSGTKADLRHFAVPPKGEAIPVTAGKQVAVRMSPLDVCRVTLVR